MHAQVGCGQSAAGVNYQTHKLPCNWNPYYVLVNALLYLILKCMAGIIKGTIHVSSISLVTLQW